MRAFVGEPRTVEGNVLPCSRCDRRAVTYVRGEARCNWHITETLPPEVRNETGARRRHQARRAGA